MLGASALGTCRLLASLVCGLPSALFALSPAEGAVTSVVSAGTERVSCLLFVSDLVLVCCPRCCHVMAHEQPCTQDL